MDNKKEQTELKATNIISLFHQKKIFFFFFWVKKAGRHFGFLKKAGRHQKGAGRRALQKRPRQNTAVLPSATRTLVLAPAIRWPLLALVIRTPRYYFPQSGHISPSSFKPSLQCYLCNMYGHLFCHFYFFQLTRFPVLSSKSRLDFLVHIIEDETLQWSLSTV